MSWVSGELPEVDRAHARRLVVSLALFWAAFAVGGPFIDRPIFVAAFLVAFPAGFTFYATLFKIWGTRLFVLPGRGAFREGGKQYAAMHALFRPTFIRRVFRATGWPPVLVGVLLLALLAGAVLSVTVVAPPTEDQCYQSNC